MHVHRYGCQCTRYATLQMRARAVASVGYLYANHRTPNATEARQAITNVARRAFQVYMSTQTNAYVHVHTLTHNYLNQTCVRVALLCTIGT